MAGTGDDQQQSYLRQRQGIVLAGFLVVAGYFLWTEHEAHVRGLFPYWPWLLLLACPLMHLFMHHGHNHGKAEEVQESHDREDR